MPLGANIPNTKRKISIKNIKQNIREEYCIVLVFLVFALISYPLPTLLLIRCQFQCWFRKTNNGIYYCMVKINLHVYLLQIAEKLGLLKILIICKLMGFQSNNSFNKQIWFKILNNSKVLLLFNKFKNYSYFIIFYTYIVSRV